MRTTLTLDPDIAAKAKKGAAKVAPFFSVPPLFFSAGTIAAWLERG